jgi:glutamyl-tRNA reductase
VLLIGTGAYAGASLAALRDRGVGEVRVFSGSGRAARFARTHDVAAVEPDGLVEAIAVSDVVITCTVAPSIVVGEDAVRAAAVTPGALPRRLIVDLGLPRNVDPAVAHVDGVELLDLETIRIHAPLAELEATEDARALVGRAAADFAAQTAEQRVEPALVALRRHVFDVLDDEIERAKGRGDDGSTEAALRHLAGVLLHTPSVRARELARSGEAEAFIAGAEALFGIEPRPERPLALHPRRDPGRAEEAS